MQSGAERQWKSSRHVPIASLDNALPIVESTYILASVSIIWPYSPSSQSYALLLVEPDARLRGDKGQLRVQFHGAAAHEVASLHAAIGDLVELELAGGVWVEESAHVKTPGRSVDGELSFRDTLNLRLKAGSAEIQDLMVNEAASSPPVPRYPATPTPKTFLPAAAQTPIGPEPARMTATPVRWGLGASAPRLNSSQDDFNLEERPKKRIRTSGSWRYERSSASPPKQLSDASAAELQPLMSFGASRPHSLDLRSASQADLSQASPSRLPGSGPSSPRLRPLESATLPEVSPLYALKMQHTSTNPLLAHIAKKPAWLSRPDPPLVLRLFPDLGYDGAVFSRRHDDSATDRAHIEVMPSSDGSVPIDADLTTDSYADKSNETILESPTNALASRNSDSTSDVDSPHTNHDARATDVNGNAQLPFVVDGKGETKAVNHAEAPFAREYPSNNLGTPTPSDAPSHSSPTDIDLEILADVDCRSRQPREVDLQSQEGHSDIVCVNAGKALSETSRSEVLISGSFRPEDDVHVQDLLPSTPELILPDAETNQGFGSQPHVPSSQTAHLTKQAVALTSSSVATHLEANQAQTRAMTRRGGDYLAPYFLMPIEFEDSSQLSTYSAPQVLETAEETLQIPANGAKAQDSLLQNGGDRQQKPDLGHLQTSEDAPVPPSLRINDQSPDDNAASCRTGLTRLNGDRSQIPPPTNTTEGHVYMELTSPDSHSAIPSRSDSPSSQIASKIPASPTLQDDREVASQDRVTAIPSPDLMSRQSIAPAELAAQKVMPLAHETSSHDPDVSQAGASPPLPRKRLSEVPHVISKWFTADRELSFADASILTPRLKKPHVGFSFSPAASISNVEELPNLTGREEQVPSKEFLSRIESSHHENLTPPEAPIYEEKAKRMLLTRPKSSKGFRTDISYYSPLSHLDRFVNQSSQSLQGGLDVIAVVTSPTSKPERAKTGPKDQYTTLHVWDRSCGADKVQVQVFRHFKDSLPIAENGDVILLRNFVVKSRLRRSFLLSADASAWHVWRFSSQKGNIDNTLSPTQESRGPPVELGPMEHEHAAILREWWKSHS